MKETMRCKSSYLPRTEASRQGILQSSSKRIAIRKHQVLVVVICPGFTGYQAAAGARFIADAKQEVIVTVRASWVTAVTAQKPATWVCKGAKQ